MNCKPVDVCGGVGSVVGVGVVGAVDGVDNSVRGDVPTDVDVVGTVVDTVERKSYIFLSNSKPVLLKAISNNSQQLQVVNYPDNFCMLSCPQTSHITDRKYPLLTSDSG